MKLREPFADVKRVAAFLEEQGYDEYRARMIAASVVKRWAKPRTKAAAREER